MLNFAFSYRLPDAAPDREHFVARGAAADEAADEAAGAAAGAAAGEAAGGGEGRDVPPQRTHEDGYLFGLHALTRIVGSVYDQLAEEASFREKSQSHSFRALSRFVASDRDEDDD